MCDYCDCRSHPAIAALSRDHETLLSLAARLRRAADTGDADTAARLADDIHSRLPGHAAEEEAGIFTELRAADVDGDYVDRFEADHRAIHELQGTAATSRPWRSGARALAEALQAHIEREEYDLFPSAHQLLAPAAWDRIDAVRAR
jgi:hypothetical protein